MFGFGKGGSQERLSPNDSSLNFSTSSLRHPIALDGPPSPERIRAYTEQMKRSSVFGNRSRSDANSSGALSFDSDNSGTASGDRVLSRKSSIRSTNASNMALRGERPESMHLFTKTIFSRHRKSSLKGGANNHNGGNTSTTSSLGIELGGVHEVSSARDRYYGKSKHGRRATQVHDEFDYLQKANISNPFFFQHLTHTQREQLPNLERRSKMDLASEFSAIRASQIPSRGELKGIKAEELHFENMSSETLDGFSEFTGSGADERPRPKALPNRRNVLRKSSAALHVPPLKMLNHTKSHETIQAPRTPPPRPPRSPLSPKCPVVPPTRVSSRAASGSLDAFNTSEAPYKRSSTNSRTRGFSCGATSIPAPTEPSWEQAGKFVTRDLPHRPVVEAAWPLTGTNENFGAELADVPEEEERLSQRPRSPKSRRAEVRWSKSLPDFSAADSTRIPQREATTRQRERLNAGFSETYGASVPASNSEVSPNSSPQRYSRILVASHDDWEDDIDYCYEHEAEADCYFEWKRQSIDEDSSSPQSKGIFAGESSEQQQQQQQEQEEEYQHRQQEQEQQHFATSPSPKSVRPSVMLEENRFSPSKSDLHHPNPERFQPSLLIPSPIEVPELSPMSINSIEPGLRTPLNAENLQPYLFHGEHRRSPPFTSSFKESHGPSLSPSLLISPDFASQVEQDQLYERLLDSSSSTLDLNSDPYIYNPSGTNRESVIMGGSSNRSSLRSSGFSRGSVSFRSSNLSKKTSQESMVLLSRKSTTSYGGGHSSVGSLPELIVSSRPQEKEVEAEEFITEAEGFMTKAKQPGIGSTAERERDRINELLRQRESYMTTTSEEHLNTALSPVAESFNFLSPVAESHDSMERGSDGEDENITALKPAPVPRREIRGSASTSNLQNHGRKLSAPLISPITTRPGIAGRQRSASSANLLQQAPKPPRRGSYTLFPQSNQY